MIHNNRIISCYWNTSCVLDKMRCRFSCHLPFKKSMKILTTDDIQQSYIKLLLKHFMPSRHIEVSVFLSSPFQINGEDPNKWWSSTIVYKAVTETLHALLTNWGVAFPVISISNIRRKTWQMMIFNNRIKSCYWNTSCPLDKLKCRFSCHLHFKYSAKNLTNDDIQQSYKKLLLKHFTPSWQIEVSLFLSSSFQIFGEKPDKWWYSTIVHKAVTETLRALPTNWGVAFPVISLPKNRWGSWQLVICKKRI